MSFQEDHHATYGKNMVANCHVVAPARKVNFLPFERQRWVAWAEGGLGIAMWVWKLGFLWRDCVSLGGYGRYHALVWIDN